MECLDPGQIKECALFVPVISANTSTRSEGYFRLEWKLAVESLAPDRRRPSGIPCQHYILVAIVSLFAVMAVLAVLYNVIQLFR